MWGLDDPQHQQADCATQIPLSLHMTVMTGTHEDRGVGGGARGLKTLKSPSRLTAPHRSPSACGHTWIQGGGDRA